MVVFELICTFWVTKKSEKYMKRKKERMSLKVLIVEGRVQIIKSGPKMCDFSPFCSKFEFAFKSEFYVDFNALLTVSLRTFVFHIISLLTKHPQPRYNPYTSILGVLCVQYVEFGIGMSIWCHQFLHLSSSIPFMRSYPYIHL